MQKKYQVRNVTPEAFDCGVGSCPAIYEVVERTPKEFNCVIGACPKIYKVLNNQKYVIVGKLEKPEEFGLEKKVGEDEVLISVPRGLIDDMKR